MLQNLAHKILVNLVRGHKPIHRRRVVKRIHSGPDSSVACRCRKTGGVEQILTIDNHLCPAIDGNSGCHTVKLRHGYRTRSEGIFLQCINDVRICLYIKDTGFCPRQHVLQCMVDHIGKVTGSKGRRGAGTKVFLLYRDDLNRVTRLLVEIICHRLLFGKALRLILSSPEADCISLRYAHDKGGNHSCRCR